MCLPASISVSPGIGHEAFVCVLAVCCVSLVHCQLPLLVYQPLFCNMYILVFAPVVCVAHLCVPPPLNRPILRRSHTCCPHAGLADKDEDAMEILASHGLNLDLVLSRCPVCPSLFSLACHSWNFSQTVSEFLHMSVTPHLFRWTWWTVHTRTPWVHHSFAVTGSAHHSITVGFFFSLFW